jgi:hypothetical protein
MSPNLNLKLRKACYFGNTTLANQLLKKGANIHYSNGTIFLEACANNNYKIAKMCLKKESDFNDGYILNQCLYPGFCIAYSNQYCGIFKLICNKIFKLDIQKIPIAHIINAISFLSQKLDGKSMNSSERTRGAKNKSSRKIARCLDYICLKLTTTTYSTLMSTTINPAPSSLFTLLYKNYEFSNTLFNLFLYGNISSCEIILKHFNYFIYNSLFIKEEKNIVKELLNRYLWISSRELHFEIVQLILNNFTPNIISIHYTYENGFKFGQSTKNTIFKYCINRSKTIITHSIDEDELEYTSIKIIKSLLSYMKTHQLYYGVNFYFEVNEVFEILKNGLQDEMLKKFEFYFEKHDSLLYKTSFYILNNLNNLNNCDKKVVVSYLNKYLCNDLMTTLSLVFEF